MIILILIKLTQEVLNGLLANECKTHAHTETKVFCGCMHLLAVCSQSNIVILAQYNQLYCLKKPTHVSVYHRTFGCKPKLTLLVLVSFHSQFSTSVFKTQY